LCQPRHSKTSFVLIARDQTLTEQIQAQYIDDIVKAEEVTLPVWRQHCETDAGQLVPERQEVAPALLNLQLLGNSCAGKRFMNTSSYD
tara:strand:+ start:1669 stop:1932 length:264 start_codon:yes stop_codon:yes gene_type:complete